METNEIRVFFEAFVREQPVDAVLSGIIGEADLLKVRVRPVLSGNRVLFQAEEFRGKQAFHKNMEQDEAVIYLSELTGTVFRQVQAETEGWTGQILCSKKGKVSVKRKKKSTKAGENAAGEVLENAWKQGLSHNRKKHYILEEGKAVPFLVDLGVQTKDGKTVNSRYDKFRQINRFLEFIEDVLPKLDKSRESVIIGLDLKEDVIKKCNELARRYGYEKLSFYTGDIASYEGVDHVDMVVTLHACDTATDYALEKAVRWGASVILSVPCCQHELNGQMESGLLDPLFRYGIIKERMAALCTDALRAEILEACGYRTQILEFIDMEHTPKNLLIRAVKQGGAKENRREIEAVMDELHVYPALYRLLMENKN